MADAVQMYKYSCLMCTNPYTEPRLLLCGHTFCCRCLSSYINEEYVTADDRLYFPCPVCETPTYNDDVNADVSTWATCLPKNDLLVSPTAQMSGVQFCDPCLRGKESNPAEVTCTECEEKLCIQCRIHHERSKLSATHQLNSISGNIGLLASVYEMCHQHVGNTFDFYCVDHSAMCCNTCVLVSHRQCNNVKPMKDVIKKSTATPSPVESELKEVTEEIKKMIEEDDLGIDALNAKEKEVLTVMTDRIDKAKDKLDNMKKTFQSDVADIFRLRREQLMTRRKCVHSFHINVENSHQLISDSEHQLSDRHRFVIREHTKNQILGHYRRMHQNTKKEANRFDITLKLDETIDKIMKMPNIGTVEITSSHSPVSQNANGRITSMIGSLLSTPSATNFGDSTSTSDLAGSLQHLTVQTTSITTAVDVWTGSVSCVHTVNASTLRGVCRPWLTGGIFTDNNELLITDYTNNRLLLFDDKYSYQRECKVDGNPIDIARGRTPDEIFVTVYQNSILRCTLRNGQLSEISRISGPPDTWGIAVHGDNILAGTYNSVKVMSVNGKVTKSIKKAGCGTYLAVSTYNSTVYQKDNNDVVCRRLDSDAVVYRYRDPGLRGPVGIGLDRDHNVYVCGYFSRNVYLISPDGSRGRVLLPKLSGITNPYGIVVHPTKQEFVVTSRQESTALEVYRFSDDNM
ncbi:tripartite motif-containing protein 3-like [Argopecten irradians]|uniref:tripartite motif-containing protein 3-like n=1 Tax=Argopecten irradians TaxID=31199 RepID=UPI003715FE52